MDAYNPNYVPTLAYFLLGVKTIISDGGNKVLLLQRSNKVSRPHGWDFPGGGVDKGENPLQAVIREIKEETGLQLTNVRMLTAYLDASGEDEAVVIGYTAQAVRRDVQLGWEHEAYRWMTLEELKSIKLPDLHSAILNAYLILVDPTHTHNHVQ